jgi:NADPH-dependent curcumin reductase CurA
MPSITSREIRLRSRPQERPTEENFELATVEMPPLLEGDVLVSNPRRLSALLITSNPGSVTVRRSARSEGFVPQKKSS